MQYVTHKEGKPYVRITFKAAGSKRRRTTFALRLSSSGNTNKYLVVDKEGDPYREVDGRPTKEIVVTTKEDVEEVPARLNLFYGELEVVK